MIAPKMILEKFSDACKVLGHVLVMALQCSTTDFDELGVAPQALNLLYSIKNLKQINHAKTAYMVFSDVTVASKNLNSSISNVLGHSAAIKLHAVTVHTLPGF